MQEGAAEKFHFKTSLSRFTSLDHLVGEQLNRVRHLNAKCPCRLQVDDELELAGLQNRQVGGLRALEDSTGVDADLSVILYQTDSVTDKPARHHELTKRVYGWNRMACRECNELLNPADEKSITTDKKRPGPCLN